MSERIIEKIQKLLNQAQSEKGIGNEEAGEAFAAAAQKLLIKYKLDIEAVTGHKAKDKDPLTSSVLKPSSWGDEVQDGRVVYSEDLAKVIAENFFCRLLVDLNSNSLIFVGRKSDIEIAQYVFCAVMREGLRKCEGELSQAILASIDTGGSLDVSLLGERFNDEFRYSFFCGYNGTIAFRLYEQRRDMEAEAGDCTALVRIEKEVETYIMEEIKPQSEVHFQEREILLESAKRKGVVHGSEASLSAASGLGDNNFQQRSLNE